MPLPATLSSELESGQGVIVMEDMDVHGTTYGDPLTPHRLLHPGARAVSQRLQHLPGGRHQHMPGQNAARTVRKQFTAENKGGRGKLVAALRGHAMSRRTRRYGFPVPTAACPARLR